MVDTANTLCKAAQALRERGAQQVVAYARTRCCRATAVERIANSVLDELVVTDTIPLTPKRRRACRRSGSCRARHCWPKRFRASRAKTR